MRDISDQINYLQIKLQNRQLCKNHWCKIRPIGPNKYKIDIDTKRKFTHDEIQQKLIPFSKHVNHSQSIRFTIKSKVTQTNKTTTRDSPHVFIYSLVKIRFCVSFEHAHVLLSFYHAKYFASYDECIETYSDSLAHFMQTDPQHQQQQKTMPLR